jgi:hypothetical protein
MPSISSNVSPPSAYSLTSSTTSSGCFSCFHCSTVFMWDRLGHPRGCQSVPDPYGSG